MSNIGAIMSLTIEATYENGVSVPAQRPNLSDHARVRLVIEQVELAIPIEENPIEFRRHRRIKLDPQLAREIASLPEFLPEAS